MSLFSKQPAEFIGTLKTEDGEWKPDALELVKKGHKKFMDGVVERFETKLDKAEQEKGRVVRERMKKAEDHLSTMLEKYGIEKSDVLEETLDSLVESIEAKSANNKRSLSDDEVKNLPLFRQALAEGIQNGVAKSNKDLQAKYDLLNKEYTDYKGKEESKRMREVMLEWSEKYLSENKAAIEGKDLAKRREQITRLNRLIEIGYKVKVVEQGQPPILVNENDEPLVDKETYQPITYADIVKKESEILFGVNNFDPTKNSPSPTSQPSGAVVRHIGKAPQSQSEYLDMIRAEKDPDKRRAITEAFKSQKAAG